MSTENKKKVLLGLGAFAAILIAVLVIWHPPAFRSEDASGSIGAVQKHHEPQITQKDVILGNETTRHEQQIRYADFLNDAAKLHALSAKITANNFDAAATEMDAMRAEVKQRYIAAANEALDAAKALARSDNRKMDSDIEGLSAILQSGQLSDAQMESFNKKLAAFSDRLAVKTAAQRAQSASSEVAAAIAEMRTNEANATAKMNSAVSELKAIDAISLVDEVDYLQATEVESKALDRAQADLKMMGARDVLAQADVLEARAAKSMERQLGLIIVICSAVRDMDAKLAEARVAEASVAGRSQAYDRALASASQAFAGTTAEINAQVNAGVNTELSALNAYLDNSAQSGSRTPQLKSFLASLSNQLNNNTALAASLAQREDLRMRTESMVNQKNAQKTAARN
jgi:hypothetical protein